MIDLTKSITASALLHTVEADPGMVWEKDPDAVIQPPPDGVVDPAPQTRWPTQAVRTGVCGVVSPRVIRLRHGAFRMFYTQILPRPGYPDGANDYDHSTTRILSASSPDGRTWTPEPGVRLSPGQGGAGDGRVVSSEVVPAVGHGTALRMYYECCPGTQDQQSSIRSAISHDDGLTWNVEPGARLLVHGQNLMAPRILFLDERRSRLYCCQRGVGIVSALSADGLNFQLEPGVRVAQDGPFDGVAAFACEILRLPSKHGSGGYLMYYAGYAAANRAYILRADSDDALSWIKRGTPVISPGPAGAWDAVKSSEVCLFGLPQDGQGTTRFRMVYEACDGTAKGERGVWRIASATSLGPH